jgi:hypothetical protein
MSTESESDLAGQASRLSEEITRFSDEIDRLSRRLGVEQVKISKAVKFNRWMMVLILVLTVAVGWNTYRVNVVQERTSAEVLCPLYELFLGSYHPDRQPPERLAEYEQTFNVIRKSYDVLGCR